VSADTLRIGLDIGGTKTDAVLVGGDGGIRERVRIATSWGPAGVIETAVRAIEEVCALAGVGLADVESVGVGVPGQVDADGVLRHAVNLGVDELAIGVVLGGRIGRPVCVENDVKAAALGAARLLGSDGSIAYLNLGTGVAAGHVAEGRLRRGSRGTAGEVGHISVDPDGHECRCGQRGCIETLAGGAYVAEHWGAPSDYPVLAVFDAADLGDERAIAIRSDLARGVVSAVTVLALSVDPDRIVVGGGVTSLGERLTDLLRDGFRLAADGSDFLRSLDLEARVEILPRSLPAAAFGAAMIAVVG
jgi:predicted NBD/HSP70 family sugar kinase